MLPTYACFNCQIAKFVCINNAPVQWRACECLDYAGHIALFVFAISPQIIEEARSLQSDARLVLAGHLLKKVDDYLAMGLGRERKEIKAAVSLLEGELRDSFDELRQRAAECVATLQEWHSVSIIHSTMLVPTSALKSAFDTAYDSNYGGTAVRRAAQD